jgi:5-(carboxyamino)imidazole ribonucleotide synthase
MKEQPNTFQLPNGIKIGVLGAGQLGKMLALAAGNWHLPLYMLDQAADFPAAYLSAQFTPGNFKDYNDVYQFGKQMDLLTIEIEHVNTKALHDLAAEGVRIHPAPDKLDIIKDKGLQKLFYQEKGIPTSPFDLYEDEKAILEAISSGALAFPFVQKSRTAGYDGRGVSLIRNAAELESKLLKGPSLVEQLVDIDKELAVVVARNESGQTIAYPTVEMAFHPEANLVEFLFCPANIDEELEQKAQQLALEVIEAFDICGLLAVELFLDQSGALIVNEVAPRPHNSGHHTIDSCYTSQFEQHLRAITNMPLGSTQMKSPSVMVNLLGEDGYTGPAFYEGFADCLAIEGVHMHLYGKTITKPFRKMGHATVVDQDIEKAKEKARLVQETLRIITI